MRLVQKLYFRMHFRLALTHQSQLRHGRRFDFLGREGDGDAFAMLPQFEEVGEVGGERVARLAAGQAEAAGRPVADVHDGAQIG